MADPATETTAPAKPADAPKNEQTLRIKVEGPEATHRRDPDDDGGDGDSRRRGKPTDAELRAEAAAYRIDAKTAREEAADLRRQLDAAKAATDARVQEEVGKVSARETKLRERLVSAELRAAAEKAGLQDMDLLDHPRLDKSGIKYGDDGTITGIAEAVEGFKTAKPEWFKTPGAATGQPSGAAAAPAAKTTGAAAAPAANAAPAQTRVQDMSPEDYANFKRNYKIDGKTLNAARPIRYGH